MMRPHALSNGQGRSTPSAFGDNSERTGTRVKSRVRQ